MTLRLMVQGEVQETSIEDIPTYKTMNKLITQKLDAPYKSLMDTDQDQGLTTEKLWRAFFISAKVADTKSANYRIIKLNIMEGTLNS